MNSNPSPPRPDLDAIAAEVRDQRIDEQRARSIANRVWLRLDSQAAAQSIPPLRTEIRGCGDVRSLLEAYRAGLLDPALHLLVQDHLRHCPACRRLRDQRAPRSLAPPSPAHRPPARHLARAVLVAAALLLVTGAGTWLLRSPNPTVPALARAAGDGLRLTAAGAQRPRILRAGEIIPANSNLDTPAGHSVFVRLGDGSRIEIAPRSRLSLATSGDGAEIRLGRGSVIVEAARQGAGHLQVLTHDGRVLVKGTVFAVTSGARGSRVSVFEGEVEAEFGGNARRLRPGEQFSSSPRLSPQPLAEQIAWSTRVDEHLSLLEEVRGLVRELDRRVPRPPLRRSSRLLDLLDPATVVVAALPNISDSLVQASEIIRSRVDLSPTLARWWREHIVDPGLEPVLDRLIDEMRTIGPELGEEIVLSAASEPGGDTPARITLLAGAEHPRRLAAYLREKTTELTVAHPQPRPLLSL
ncbi:MAG TPA: hypothetical protein ENK10_07345, partial [Acidobacteria bacterium]|nr:hypothetical protein [Acidobacteriota bacterium]